MRFDRKIYCAILLQERKCSMYHVHFSSFDIHLYKSRNSILCTSILKTEGVHGVLV